MKIKRETHQIDTMCKDKIHQYVKQDFYFFYEKLIIINYLLFN